MQLVTLNGKQLREITHKNRTAEVTITSLAMRERMRTFSDIPRTRAKLIKDGEKIVEADYMQLWKDLSAAGVGAIVYGRKGRPDRFEWHFSLKQVAKAALEGVESKPQPKEAAPVVAPAKKTKTIRRPAKEATPVYERQLYVNIRRDFDVAIKLPSDVSQEEINTITRALQRVSA